MGDFTIQISSNLVSQLVDNGEKVKKKVKKPKPRITREPEQPQIKAKTKQVPNDSETPKDTAALGWPVQPPLFLPTTPSVQSTYAELEGIRSVLKESERVVEKLQKHEDNMAQEVTQKAKELRDKEFKIPYRKPPPCLDELHTCADCIKANGNDLLKCSQVINKFSNCARKAKEQADQAH